MYIVRNCEKTVKYMSERFPVVLVTGPRLLDDTLLSA
jgi:hypothetical protein